MAKKKDDVVGTQYDAVEPVPTVKVFKKQKDSMVSFCGEKMQIAEDGREFFELQDYMEPVVKTNPNLIWPEFINPVALESMK